MPNAYKYRRDASMGRTQDVVPLWAYTWRQERTSKINGVFKRQTAKRRRRADRIES